MALTTTSQTVDPIARTGVHLEEFIKHVGKTEDAIELVVYIKEKVVNMELDTGASVSLISEATWSRLNSKKKL